MVLRLCLPRRRRGMRLAIALLSSMAACAQAAGVQDVPHFIGPLATPGPPLPKGALNIEPYVVSSRSAARFDGDGQRLRSPAPMQWSTSIPIKYGVTDRFSVGGTLRGQYNRLAGGSRALATGDTTVAASFGLIDAGGAHRARLALTARQRLPTGRHDRLERRDVPGSGTGAASTTMVLHGQAYLLEGRLRARASVDWTLPGARARLRGRSVYGTDTGFDGRIRLGHGSGATASAEFSVAPRWTLVGEVLYEQDGGSTLRGDQGHGSAERRQRPSMWRLSVLPAVQYHLSDRVGLIGGLQVGVMGRNATALVAPQIAINMGF
ncbi:MAG: hypothetical protein QHC77_15270 [Stenotrophomonas sp.]|uniref:hypothetical protein n=1 Tax=unclassified Stenotrophomonas TaxID=196198 RepID=UPI000CB5397F|nr:MULTISPECIES: hypothetical protein [unclassified Stenotrophomonas]MDX3933294.1 hypothetical protein [Stenotrophomonas sp.]PKH76574.1 hypothetical protein CXF90_00955 [Stenotrophomonas sp. Betaine-02u-23]